MEIYMEKVRDLFNRKLAQYIYASLVFMYSYLSLASADNLAIHEDKARGVYVKDLCEIYVANSDEVYTAMRNGSSNRVVAYTRKLFVSLETSY